MRFRGKRSWCGGSLDFYLWTAEIAHVKGMRSQFVMRILWALEERDGASFHGYLICKDEGSTSWGE